MCAACACVFCNSFRDGKELGTESVRSGGWEPDFKAEANKCMASPTSGGETTVAASRPWRTHSWPERGTPSHPVMGSRSQASRSRISPSSSKARRAPMAMSSFWQAIMPTLQLPRRAERQPRFYGVISAILGPVTLQSFYVDPCGLGRQHAPGANFGDIPDGRALQIKNAALFAEDAGNLLPLNLSDCLVIGHHCEGRDNGMSS